MLKTYLELSKLSTFDDRFAYLKIGGEVGRTTFGYDRVVNQRFYKSREWDDIRQFVIVRDEGCDLGILGYEIFEEPHVHHMNPIDVGDIVRHEAHILDPEFLILTTHKTHNAIHYGSDVVYPKVVLKRSPRDTKLW